MDEEQFEGVIEKVDMELMGTDEEGNPKVSRPRKITIGGKTYQVWDSNFMEMCKTGNQVKGIFRPVEKGEILYRNVKGLEVISEAKPKIIQETIKSADSLTNLDTVVANNAMLLSKSYDAVKEMLGRDIKAEEMPLVSTLMIQASKDLYWLQRRQYAPE